MEQLIKPTLLDIADILNLFKGIKGRTCTASAYLEYLNLYWNQIAIFIVRLNDKIVGFTQAESPSILNPKCGSLPFSHATVQCPRIWGYKAVLMAEDWLRLLGATSYTFTTVRNPRALERAWGMKRSKEILMEKEL